MATGSGGTFWTDLVAWFRGGSGNAPRLTQKDLQDLLMSTEKLAVPFSWVEKDFPPGFGGGRTPLTQAQERAREQCRALARTVGHSVEFDDKRGVWQVKFRQPAT